MNLEQNCDAFKINKKWRVKILHRVQPVQENINHNKKPISFLGQNCYLSTIALKVKSEQADQFSIDP